MNSSLEKLKTNFKLESGPGFSHSLLKNLMIKVKMLLENEWEVMLCLWKKNNIFLSQKKKRDLLFHLHLDGIIEIDSC